MGSSCYLQDDTGLEEQSAFRYSDAKGLAYALVSVEIVPTLEQHLQLDLMPLRRVAQDWEAALDWGKHDWYELLDPNAERDASLQAQFMTLRAEMDAAWQPGAELREAIHRLLNALGWPEQSFPPAIIAAVPCSPSQRSFVEHYLGEQVLAKDLVDVLMMLRWAELRGATRVRLLVR